MSIHLHVLTGCSPAPLADYLKALGILRLVGEQSDKDVRGWWEGESFRLLTKLSKEELEAFFLEKYEPTPLLSPWNKGCGFFKANDQGLIPLEQSIATRFQRFRNGIIEARRLLAEIGKADAAIRAIKARTKTTVNSFQTKQQRALLRRGSTWREVVNRIKADLKNETLKDEGSKNLMNEMKVVISILRRADKPPDQMTARGLKSGAGYKRFLAAADRSFKSLKANLIPDCERTWRGPHAEWMSAAVVLDENGNPEWPSLLGTGGNDGNLDFTNNFMQQLGTLFDVASDDGKPKPTAKALLENCLWIAPANNLERAAIGQYQPGAAGGANSSTGFDGGNLVNAWDFVLMMEGSLLLTSRATRRLDPNAMSRASAPFALRPHAAGFATPGSEKAQRGEQWMPLWKQPATLKDVSSMYGEARAQLGRQTANRPVDMARGISRLGVARGIEAFVRYGYLERNGQSTLAVPLGRVYVQYRPRAYLIDDLASWMSRIQRYCRNEKKNPPERLVHAERRLANAVFAALTHDHTPRLWQAILLATADIEAIQATGTAIEAGPIPSLRPDWVAAVDDGSTELRLALALGSAAASYFKGQPADSVRHHLLPLEPGARRFKTTDKRLVNDPRVVLSGHDPIRDLATLVERRLIESEMRGERRSRLVPAPGCGATLSDLALLLRGAIDLDMVFGLARAFMAIKWKDWTRNHCRQCASSMELPDESWLALRLACLPWPLTMEKDIPADPRIVRLLMSGGSSRAIEIARDRIRSASIRPPFQAGVTDAPSARLWAAALAFPIHRGTALHAASILDPSLKGLAHV